VSRVGVSPRRQKSGAVVTRYRRGPLRGGRRARAVKGGSPEKNTSHRFFLAHLTAREGLGASPMMVPGGPTKPGASFTCPRFGRDPTPVASVEAAGGLCPWSVAAANGVAGRGGGQRRAPPVQVRVKNRSNWDVVWQSRTVGGWRLGSFFVKSAVQPRLLLSDGFSLLAWWGSGPRGG
jgi:hypothetical protein